MKGFKGCPFGWAHLERCRPGRIVMGDQFPAVVIRPAANAC
jgi:hypothetical protein